MSERDLGSENELDTIFDLYGFLFELCTDALKKLRTADMTDKNMLIRLIMTELSYFEMDKEMSFEDASVGFWVERAEWIDRKSFQLYVTQVKNESTGLVPERRNAPQQKLTIRREGIYTKPIITLNFLIVLSSKLRAMAYPDENSQEVLNRYYSEKDFVNLGNYLYAFVNVLTDRVEIEDESITKVN